MDPGLTQADRGQSQTDANFASFKRCSVPRNEKRWEVFAQVSQAFLHIVTGRGPTLPDPISKESWQPGWPPQAHLVLAGEPDRPGMRQPVDKHERWL